MDWQERLNRSLGRMPLGWGTVELLQWAYARHLADNRPHRHTFFEVCLVGEYGAGEFIVQDRTHRVRPGDLLVARPGVIHQIVNTGRPDMELSWVSFQWTPAPSLGCRGSASTSAKPSGAVDSLLKAFADASVLVAPDEEGQVAALWWALRAIASAPPGAAYEAQYQALATALILGIAQAGVGREPLTDAKPSGPETSDIAARLAVRFIHDNLNRPLPLAEIAAQVHLSSRHLSRLLMRFTGKSPAHYITHARMDRARGLLLRSPAPIKEIGAAVGYPDVHHFTRAFTAHFGTPPGEMRRHPERAAVPIIQKPGDLV